MRITLLTYYELRLGIDPRRGAGGRLEDGSLTAAVRDRTGTGTGDVRSSATARLARTINRAWVVGATGQARAATALAMDERLAPELVVPPHAKGTMPIEAKMDQRSDMERRFDWERTPKLMQHVYHDLYCTSLGRGSGGRSLPPSPAAARARATPACIGTMLTQSRRLRRSPRAPSGRD